jgi:small basic protein
MAYVIAVSLLIGLIIGFVLPFNIPFSYAPYLSVAILAALDSVFGGIRASFEEKFDNLIFMTGFFGNIILAGGLAYIGDVLGVPIYLAAVFVFGSRLFSNFAYIRRYLIDKMRRR